MGIKEHQSGTTSCLLSTQIKLTLILKSRGHNSLTIPISASFEQFKLIHFRCNPTNGAIRVYQLYKMAAVRSITSTKLTLSYQTTTIIETIYQYVTLLKLFTKLLPFRPRWPFSFFPSPSGIVIALGDSTLESSNTIAISCGNLQLVWRFYVPQF